MRVTDLVHLPMMIPLMELDIPDENRFRQLATAVEQSPTSIVITDIEGRITYVNPKFVQLTGYTPAEAIGETPAILKSGYTPDNEYRHLWDTISSGKEWHGEFLNRRKDGTLYWEYASISPVFDDDGQITDYVAIKENITERKQAEIRLRENEERYRTLVKAMAEGLVMQDATGQIIESNERAEAILGLSIDQMRGKTSVDPAWRSIHEDGSPFPGEEHPAMVTLRTGEPLSEVIMGVHKPDGSLTWISINSEPLFADGDSDSRSPYAVIVSFHDITQQKEAEDRAFELAIEREQARILAEFIESASHEFHTPLSIIETSVYLLERTLAPAHHPRLDVIRTQGKSISRLIQMMLTLTRLDSSDGLLLRPLRPIELLYEINDLYRHKSAMNDITWQIDGDPDTPGIDGDFRYLVVALKQLVDNALRYTPAGGTITVRLNTATGDSGDEEVILSVHDDGDGIEPVHLPRVFERFYRSDRAHSTPGFGLGLAIVRRIARTHAGYVSIESTPGNGTDVFIHLPQIDD